MRICCVMLAWLVLFARVGSAMGAEGEVDRGKEKRSPRVLDGRLKLELFTAEPEIVTPTGMGVDANGAVLAIESHTHFRPEGYDGPAADRIRRLEDTDGDGRADRITTFFEGSKDTLSVAAHPNGDVYVATRNDVFRLRDRDGDGVADENSTLVHLESTDDYPHSGLAGLAFDAAGDVYFGLGENHAHRFKLHGTDGRVLTNLEGGHIYRMKADGTKLERVAIGCWNPHAVAIDDMGRVFAVDNDPDSLPPCRLLHIVPGADFGYKYRNGRKGTHPFTAWNGELPDTLPMVAGTGEAPSGIFVCGRTGGRDRLPGDYRGDLLVTSWGDHRIERYTLTARGASVGAERVDVVVGDENFRPVGIVAGGDGAVYFSDWVDKSYTLHKKGRIWRLSYARDERREASAEDGDKAKEPLALSDEERRARSLRKAGEAVAERGEDRGTKDEAAALIKKLWEACEDADPFIRQAAREGLKRAGAVTPAIDLKDRSPQHRLAVLCVLRDLASEEAEARLPEFLSDADPGVRLVALKWVGEEGVRSQRQAVERVLTAGPTTSRLFAAYLAAVEKLDRPPRRDNQEWTDEQYVAEALLNEQFPLDVRRWALRTLRPDHPQITADRLGAWLTSGDAAMRLEAVRTLRSGALADRDERLWRIVEDTTLPAELRCEAMVGLSASSHDAAKFLAIIDQCEPPLASEALRSMRGTKLAEKDLHRLEGIAAKRPELGELIRRVTHPDDTADLPVADDLEGWLARLDGAGDAAAGERIFFHERGAGCAKCHQMDGRGGKIGPDLTVAARKLDRRRLVESILSPSKEIAPQFTVWNLITNEGHSRSGVLLGENAYTQTRTFGDAQGALFTVKIADIESQSPLANSLMPTGLEKLMTTQEFRDLLAFLLPSE